MTRPEAGSQRLSRSVAGRQAAPVRIVHLGLGNFFRAHQAWYTANAPDAASWGIAAFTGRSVDLAAAMTDQEGLYTLLTRGATGDTWEIVDAVSLAHSGPDTKALIGYLVDPAVVLVTLTVTEAGYVRGPDGHLDRTDPAVAADLAALRTLQESPSGGTVPLLTVPGRLVAALSARRTAGAGPLSVVPCDNLPDNGRVAETVVTEFAAEVEPVLVEWIQENVAFVTTMVDRITPTTTDDDIAAAAALTGWTDAVPVVTEPFSEWVLCGRFAAARPDWEAAGATFVTDIVPYEQRKLWILNGGHSLLAYLGGARGHVTVAEAMADPWCRSWLTAWWNESTDYLTLPREHIIAYREAVTRRFTNPGIRHLLAQIGTDGSQKLPVRILPLLRRKRAGGELPPAAIAVLAGWIGHLRGDGGPVSDTAKDRLTELADGPLESAVASVISFLDADLGRDEQLLAAVTRFCENPADSPLTMIPS